MSVQLGEWKDGKLFIEGLEYEFPKQPPKKEVLNYGLPKKDQVWTRITDYEKFDWSEGWEDRIEDNEEQLQYLVDEISRILNGVWVLINGEAVYLNNYTYFFLQWFMLEDGEYPQFRDTALYYYRFVELCDKAKLCTGHTLLKARRLGATSMALSALQFLLLTTKNSNFGIVSNKGNNASKAFQRVVKSMGNLPVFLRPIQEGNTAPKKVLSLKEQAQRITKDNKKGSAQGGLNNELSWENTDLNSYDSYALRGLLVDESGKFGKETPIDKYLPIVAKTLKKGAKVVGKIFMPTTCNPPTEGGAEYREIWEGSDQSKADYLGQTKTGLYRIFIPAYFGFDGYMTKYGESIWKTPTEEQKKLLMEVEGCPDYNIGAKEYLENIRKSLENNPEELQEEIRMNPFSPEEVFESANERCIFNLTNLNKREQELTDKLVDLGLSTKTGELGRRGWFRKRGNRVVWEDDPVAGLWYVHYFLPSDQTNQYRILGNGHKEPTNESFGAGGLDGYFSGQATVDKGSDGCLIIRSRKTDKLEDKYSGVPVAMLLGRLESIDDFYEQVFNGLIYYGVKMLAERAQLYFEEYAEKNKLLGYLYSTTRSNGTKVYGIPAQQNKATIEEHARVQVMSSLDDHYKIPFINLIRDRKVFNVRSRTETDVAMADGYALMALEFPIKEIKKENVKVQFLRKGRVLQNR